MLLPQAQYVIDCLSTSLVNGCEAGDFREHLRNLSCCTGWHVKILVFEDLQHAVELQLSS